MTILIYILLILPSIFDIRNNSIEIDNKKKYLFVFVCGIACKDCFVDIDKEIQKDSNRKYEYIFVVNTESKEIIAKKEAIEFYKTLIKPDKYVFIKTKGEVKEFEKSLDNNYYPVVVTVINGKERLYKYKELFGHEKTKTIVELVKSLE